MARCRERKSRSASAHREVTPQLTDLYEGSRAALRAIAAQIVGWTESEDVVHDAFIRAIERAGGFRGDSSSATWLRRILTNVAFNHRRSAKRRLTLEAVAASPASNDNRQPRWAECVDLRAAILRLPLDDQQVLHLYEVLGFTHNEIATPYASLLALQNGASFERGDSCATPSAEGSCWHPLLIEAATDTSRNDVSSGRSPLAFGRHGV
jgi:RNA polymerase sigma-70 factor (ECF subfamily)